MPGFDHPALFVVSDGSGDPARVEALARAAAAGGAWGFQIREPRLGGGALAHLVPALLALDLRVVVNDRLDVALASGAFGVQLGERGLPVDRVRALAGERLPIGRSVHDAGGARAATRAGADWIVFGHVFPTASKPGLEPAGLDGLAQACRATSRPVFAIGGITTANARAAIAQGAGGVAVIGAVARAQDPMAAVRALVRELEEA
jgi:thiamine-phosphate pyrophosphorylase